MQDAGLRQSYREACERNDYVNAHELLGKIQSQKEFPLFLPKRVQNIALKEIDDYVDLLYPLMNVYFHHGSIDELFKCSSALIDWLRKKPSEAWTDKNYRFDCDAHHRLIVFYETRHDEAAIQASCVIIVAQGGNIQAKTQHDWRVMLRAYCRLSSCGEEWVKRTDCCRGELLKLLWKNFDQTKKSFVEMCNLVDEISDADNLRKADPEIDDILKQYLSFARTHTAKHELLAPSEDRQKLLKMFLQVREKKTWETAELFLKKITTVYLGIDLDAPYAAVDQSDEKVAILLGMLTHLGMGCWEDNKRARAIPLLEKATKFILVMQQVSDELWRHSAVSAYLCALAYYEKGDFLDSTKACKRSISMFEYIRQRSPEDVDCIVKARDTLARSVSVTASLKKNIACQTAVKSVKKRLTKSVPPKLAFPPPPTLAELQRSLEQACDSQDDVTAELLVESIAAYTGVDVYLPSAEAGVSDEILRCFIGSLISLAALYFSTQPNRDKEYDAYQKALKWWDCLKIKSDPDWQDYIFISDNVCNIYIQRKDSERFLSAADKILYVYENIRPMKTEAHTFLLFRLSREAVVCCNSQHDAEGVKKWELKARGYHSVLLRNLKSELECLQKSVDEKIEKKEWDAAHSCIYDAENVVDKLCKLVSAEQVVELNNIDAYAYVFALRLYRIFQQRCAQELFSEAYDVLTETKLWMLKIRTGSDDADLFCIECDIQEKALAFVIKKKWKMKSALELARKAMPEEDKTKKMEIENRKKAQADIEKAARGQKRQEELQERTRKRQEASLQAAAKEAEERQEAEMIKKHQIEKSTFVGFYRKFKKLSVDEVEVIYRSHRKLSSKILNLNRKCYVEGSFRDVACQHLILACEALMDACDVILSCYLKSQLNDYKEVSYEELLQLNPVFTRAWNLYSKSAEWERLAQEVEVCAQKLGELQIAPVSFFPIKDKVKNGFHKGFSQDLMQQCESALNDLVQSRQPDNLKKFSDAEKKLGAICEELFERYPGFEDILYDESHEHYEIMSILESCRENFGKLNRVANTMPCPERVKEMCGKLHDRIEEVERLRKTCSM